MSKSKAHQTVKGIYILQLSSQLTCQDTRRVTAQYLTDILDSSLVTFVAIACGYPASQMRK